MIDQKHDFIRTGFLILSLVITFVMLCSMPVHAAAELEVTPITWNIVGLDSNDVNSGPNHFPVGVRISNTGDAAATTVVADFVWDDGLGVFTGDPLDDDYINLRPGTLSTINFMSPIAAGSFVDAYFEAEVTRDSGAYDNTREYHIDVTADGPITASSPIPRELFVEHLISQARNGVWTVRLDGVDIPDGGTMNMVVGSTYTITLGGSTATQGYNQLEAFITMPNTIFQVLSVSTLYSANDSPYVPNPNNKLYADACGWDPDLSSPNYLSCIGGGYKAGGTVETTYTVKILQVPGAPLVNPEPLTNLVYDFSGSSFHYNSDYGTSVRFAEIFGPSSVTIDKTFIPKTIAPDGTSVMTITLTNPTPETWTGVNFSDVFPVGMSLANTTTSITGLGAGAFSPVLTAGDTSISFSGGTLAPNSTGTITLNVTADTTAASYVNTTNNLFINSTTDTGNTGSDTLYVDSGPLAPSSCPGSEVTMATWTMPLAGQGSGGPPPPYTTQETDVTATAIDSAAGVWSILADPGGAGGGGTNTWATIWNDSVDSPAGTATPPPPDSLTLPYFDVVVEYPPNAYNGVTISFKILLEGAGGSWGAPADNYVYVYEEADNNGFNAGTAFQTDASDWFTYSRAAGTSGSTKTTFRITFLGSQQNKDATVYVDDISITGCERALLPDPPTISKAFLTDPIAQGATSTLRFTITNPNAGSALSGIAFTDELPTGLTVATGSSAACGGGTLTLTAPRTITLSGAGLAAGAGTSCDIDVTVTGTTAGQYTNISANVSATESGPNYGGAGDGYATDTLTVIAPPILSKRFESTPILTGDTSVLTFTITNPNSADALTGVAFTDVLPAGLTISDSSTTQCGGTLTTTAATRTIALTGTTIAADSFCTFSVTVTGSAVGTHTNTTAAPTSTNGGTGTAATANIVVRDPVANISLLKQISPTGAAGSWVSYATVPEGGDVYYLFTVENTGDVALSPVSVSDLLVSVAGCTWTDPLPVPVAANDNHITTCTVGPVAAVDGGETNTATASGTYGGSPYTDIGSAIYATLSIDKTTTTPDVGRDGVVIYTIVVDNSGIDDLANFQVTDVVPYTAGEFSVLDVTAAVTSGTITVNPGYDGSGDVNLLTSGMTLEASATATITINLQLINATTGTYDNSATAFTPRTGNTVFDGTTSGAEDVTVSAATIDAVNDDFSGTPLYNFIGGTTATVFTNDTLNGAPFAAAAVTATIPAGGDGGLTGVTINAAGQLVIPAGAAIGTYTVVYQICDVLIPSNCDTATVEVRIVNINAVDDDFSANAVSSDLGGTTPTVYTNDTIDGAPFLPAEVIPSITADGGLTGVSINADGTLNVPAGTAVGTYNVTYQICVATNPAVCVTAIATVTVKSISAVNDSGASVNGAIGGVSLANVLANDILNGNTPVDQSAPNANRVVLTQVSTTHAGVTLNPATGAVSVAPGTPAGTYIVTYQICEFADATNCDTATVTVPVTGSADLVVAKTNSAASVAEGGTTIYTLTLTNNGPSHANGATLSDPAAAGLTKTSIGACTALGGAVCPTVGAGAGQMNITNLQAGTVVVPTLPSGGSISFTVTANVTASAGDTVANIFSAATPALVTDPTPGNNSATDSDPVTAAADLVVTKTNSETSVASGGTTTYTLTLTNNGPSAADSATLSDPAAAGLTKTAIGACTAAGGAVCPTVGVGVGEMNIANLEAGTVVVPTLPNGGSISFTVTATVTAPAGGSVANTFSALPPAGVTDPTPGDASATDTDPVNPAGDLAVTKTNGAASVIAGSSTTYTLTLTNNGPSAANGATLSDPAAAGLTKTSIGACAAAGGAVCPTVGAGAGQMSIANLEAGIVVVPTLPSGGSISFTVTATVTEPAPGPVANTFSASTPPGVTDPTPGNNNATDTDTVTVAVTATGVVEIAETTPSGQPVWVRVTDADLNTDPLIAETVIVTVVNGRTGESEFITLTETGPNTGIFTADLPTTDDPLAGVDDTGNMNTQAGDTLTVTYVDALDAGGLVNQIRVDTGVITAAGSIDAIEDIGATVNGVIGGQSFANVLVNDRLNGLPLLLADVILTQVSTTNPGVTLNPGDGSVNVAPGTPAGTYVVTYQICETASPANCDTATVTVMVTAPALTDLSVTMACETLTIFQVGCTFDPPTQLAYTITVENNGPNAAPSVSITDALPDGLIPVSYTIDGTPFASWIIPCALGSLNPGESIEVQIYVQLCCDITVVDSNSVSVSDPNITDTIPGNNSFICINPVVFAPVVSKQALEFDFGSSTYVSVTQDVTLDLAGTGSLEAWIYPTAFDADAGIVIKGTGNACYAFGLGGGALFSGGASNNIGFVLYDTTGTKHLLTDVADTLVANQWYHIACVWDISAAPTMAIYVNGILGASTPAAVPDVRSNVEDLTIGTQNISPADFSGLIDDVRIWNTARTENEIRSFMCKNVVPFPTPDPELVTYLMLDEGSGILASDVSGNGNIGFIFNASRVCSSAPIGDDSAFSYSGPYSATLASPDGDNITIAEYGGTWDAPSKSGIQVYRVDSPPNYTSTPLGWNISFESSLHYWGTFTTGGVSPTYTMEYDYNGYPGIINEDTLKIGYRDNYCDTLWQDLQATLHTSITTLIKSGLSGTEFILGSNVDPRNTIHFDGIDDYVEVTDDASLDLGATGTLEAWIYIDSQTANGGIIHKGDDADTPNNDEAYFLRLGAATNQIVLGVNNGGGATTLTSTTNLSTDTWYHVAGVWDNAGPSMDIYINGVNDGTQASAAIAQSTTGNVNIGQQFTITAGASNFFPFDGYIDEVRIWNVARAQNQIRNTMCHTLVGTEGGLVGYWRFDEETIATSSPDGSTSGNTATMYQFGTDGAVITARTCSAAPIGKASAWSYYDGGPGTVSTTLSHPDGDYMFATENGGYWFGTFSGLQVYRVDSAPVYPPHINGPLPYNPYVPPNGLTPPPGWSSVDYYRYWGIFLTDWVVAVEPQYQAVYDYGTPGSGNPNVPQDETVIDLAKRDAYCDRFWADATATLNTTTNTLTKSGETQNSPSKIYTEYVLAGKDKPLAIALSSFTAKVADDCIEISWETATEIDTTGFQLWRCESKNGVYDLVPYSYTRSTSVTDTRGAEYSFTDCSVVLDGKTDYYYKLEEIALNSAKDNPLYGPIGPVKETVSASQLSSVKPPKSSSDACFIDSLR
jgi:uncharacterized repeat protein (TIGR01451 family)